MSRVALMRLIMLLGLGALLAFPRTGYVQPALHRAGLVVQFADKHVATACVTFPEDEITGFDLLDRSGIPYLAQLSGVGAAICKIGGDGCAYPAENCFCKCQGASCQYWAFYVSNGATWAFSNIGASSTKVHDGDVQAWSWGSGSMQKGTLPPTVDPAQICPAPVATPTLKPVATQTPPAPTATATHTPPTATLAPTDPPRKVQPLPSLTPRPTRTPPLPTATIIRTILPTATQVGALAVTATRAPTTAAVVTPSPIPARATRTPIPSPVPQAATAPSEPTTTVRVQPAPPPPTSPPQPHRPAPATATQPRPTMTEMPQDIATPLSLQLPMAPPSEVLPQITTAPPSEVPPQVTDEVMLMPASPSIVSEPTAPPTATIRPTSTEHVPPTLVVAEAQPTILPVAAAGAGERTPTQGSATDAPFQFDPALMVLLGVVALGIGIRLQRRTHRGE